MNKVVGTLGAFAIAGNLIVSGILLSERGQQELPGLMATEDSVVDRLKDPVAEVGQLRAELSEIRSELELGRDLTEETTTTSALEERLSSMEKRLTQIESASLGPSIDEAAAERSEQFRSPDGHLKAEEYFAAGQFELAGQGFLAYLEAHPDDPEHRSLVKKAIQSFAAAGNLDRAIAIQEELMEIYPENKAGDLMTLARLQQQAGKYEEAARNASSSADLVNDSSKYWNLLYSAWYTQLGEGLDAGLSAHREVEAQIMAAGHGEGKLGERVREKIAEIEREMALRDQ